VAGGAIAIAGIFVVDEDSHRLFHSLSAGRALPAVLASAAAGLATLGLVYGRRFEPARYTAALAVGAVVAGWGLARWPTILPGLTVREAAAGHDTLVAIVVAVVAGAVVLFPSLGFLFRLAVAGRFRAAEAAPPEQRPRPLRSARQGLLARSAVVCLFCGFGLLTVAGAPWAHGIGIVSLVAFVVLAFRALVLPDAVA
jgi:cytochrome d ubiquinol oxidase subunit II